MIPTFSVRGDWLLISRRHDHGKNIKVGDVVRFAHPSFLGVNGAKRVIGMPGDFVCKDPVYSTDVGANNEMIQVCSFYNDYLTKESKLTGEGARGTCFCRRG